MNSKISFQFCLSVNFSLPILALSQKKFCLLSWPLFQIYGLTSSISATYSDLASIASWKMSDTYLRSGQFSKFCYLFSPGDIGRLKDNRGIGSGDSYGVLLLYDQRHREKTQYRVVLYVCLHLKVLPQAVPSVAPDNARRIFSESQENGVAVVIVTVKGLSEISNVELLSDVEHHVHCCIRVPEYC